MQECMQNLMNANSPKNILTIDTNKKLNYKMSEALNSEIKNSNTQESSESNKKKIKDKSNKISTNASPKKNGAVTISIHSTKEDFDEKAEVKVELKNPDAVVEKMLQTLANKFPPESVVTVATDIAYMDNKSYIVEKSSKQPTTVTPEQSNKVTQIPMRFYYGFNNKIYLEDVDKHGHPNFYYTKDLNTGEILPLGPQAYSIENEIIPNLIIDHNKEVKQGIPVSSKVLHASSGLLQAFYEDLNGIRYWEALDTDGQHILYYAVDSSEQIVKPVGAPVYTTDDRLIPNLIRRLNGEITQGIPVKCQTMFTETSNIKKLSQELPSKLSMPKETVSSQVPQQNLKTYSAYQNNYIPQHSSKYYVQQGQNFENLPKKLTYTNPNYPQQATIHQHLILQQNNSVSTENMNQSQNLNIKADYQPAYYFKNNINNTNKSSEYIPKDVINTTNISQDFIGHENKFEKMVVVNENTYKISNQHTKPVHHQLQTVHITDSMPHTAYMRQNKLYSLTSADSIQMAANQQSANETSLTWAQNNEKTMDNSNQLGTDAVKIPAPVYLLADGSIVLLAIESDGRPLDGFAQCPKTNLILPVGEQYSQNYTNYIKDKNGNIKKGFPILKSTWDSLAKQAIPFYITSNNFLVPVPLDSEGHVLHGLACDTDGSIKPVGLSMYPLNSDNKNMIMCADGRPAIGIALQPEIIDKIQNNHYTLSNLTSQQNKNDLIENSMVQSMKTQYKSVNQTITEPIYEEVVKKIKVPQIIDIPHDVEKIVRKIETKIVEKIIEVPGPIIEVPQTNYIEQETFVPRYTDKAVPTVVGQQIQPVFYNSTETVPVKCLVTEPRIVTVDIFVPKPVQSHLKCLGKTTETHQIVNVPPAHLNTLTKKINPELEEKHLLQLLVVEENGVPLLPTGERIETVQPITYDWTDSFYPNRVYASGGDIFPTYNIQEIIGFESNNSTVPNNFDNQKTKLLKNCSEKYCNNSSKFLNASPAVIKSSR